MRVVFYKSDLAWPRSSGHDVHTYHMMHAMSDLGAQVSLATAHKPPEDALAGLLLEEQVVLDATPNCAQPSLALTPLEERFRSYWGVPAGRIAVFASLVRRLAADAVVVSGLDVLPMLGGVSGPVRVWYAGDEWAWHHLSQLRVTQTSSWTHLRDAAVTGLYERAFRRRIDRAWAVSEPDRRALRHIAGVSHVDTISNGVGADFYKPMDAVTDTETAVFWGRLDFGPNVQALEWFVNDVWPAVRAARPQARFTIIGFRPIPSIRALASAEGVELIADAEDIRPLVSTREVVVLPFVSGGGIKNKLLEAASMGKAIVATPRAMSGLNGVPPIKVARRPAEWVTALETLWDSEAVRRNLGTHARAWVTERHTWRQAAQTALCGLQASLTTRRRQ